jgi:predicted GIY-YIG superfamily endonuclease
MCVKRRSLKFNYVCILQSEIDQKRLYTGFTEDLDSRLKSHNPISLHHLNLGRSKTSAEGGDSNAT